MLIYYCCAMIDEAERFTWQNWQNMFSELSSFRLYKVTMEESFIFQTYNDIFD